MLAIICSQFSAMFSAHLQRALPAKIPSSHASVVKVKMGTNFTFTTQTMATAKLSTSSYALTRKRPIIFGIREEAAMQIATVCPTIAKWKLCRTFLEDSTFFQEWLRGRSKNLISATNRQFSSSDKQGNGSPFRYSFLQRVIPLSLSFFILLTLSFSSLQWLFVFVSSHTRSAKNA